MAKIINDPVHGFIEIPDGIISQLVRHPYVFRLSRIKQLGPTDYVYPGGRHTRFEHSLGAYHLACQAIESLREKDHNITENDAEGVKIAILLHDIGHGPFSHVLEENLVHGISHEDITCLLMEKLNEEFQGKLSTAIQVFKNEHPKYFLSELIHSQLDLDRMDYLCRDSFYAGVREGNIGAARIIKMLDIKDNQLVVNWKGVYTIENYLMARRLMYWQVYLHKTVVAAKEILTMSIQRAHELLQQGKRIFTTPALDFFLANQVDKTFMAQHPEWVEHFINLDDSDMECALKQWTKCDDTVLSTLATDYIQRHLYKVIILSDPITEAELKKYRQQLATMMNITESEAAYFIRNKEVHQVLYSTADDHIMIRFKDNSVKDISSISELLGSEMVDNVCRRNFLFVQREYYSKLFT